MATTGTASDFFKCANNLLNFLKALTIIKTIIFDNCLDFTERLIALSFHYLCKWLVLLREMEEKRERKSAQRQARKARDHS